ncbi:MAG: cytochrome-c oxidase [Acidobacteria bacterium]|nr:cytochrome-c oxidase [Acidobacteriota bacterium]NIM62281.1 cytochrome-c oxidase [Acidobacteriota bacterium]NIO59835.1 cytochrome-c oxidase [Acidobacteriota bacterium]NIQ30920.1 cytochrome-c oxidase [Acidobacteriota bacterium]NIQ85994.1 cytochrome-c oxidase [Acidobacteriota bacterium]
MGKSHAEISRHMRVYLMVFGALLVLTAATVGAWKLEFLPAGAAVALALAIALCKASLVALYFMHLSAENKMIYWILALTFVFFLVLLLVPVLTAFDVIAY